MMLAFGKQVNCGSGEYTKSSLVCNQLTTSSCFEAYEVQRFHLQEVCAWDKFCILPTMKKSMTLLHIRIFPFHSALL